MALNNIEQEIKKRIKLSIYAYAYEVENDSLIDDAEYDRLSNEINTDINTGNELMDRFFREEFDKSTGMWILKHPEIEKIKHLYDSYYKK